MCESPPLKTNKQKNCARTEDAHGLNNAQSY